MPRSRAVKRGHETGSEELVRFGVSVPAALIRQFEALYSGREGHNRSEAIRELIKERLVQEKWKEGKGEQLATVTLVYDSQHAPVQRRLLEQKRALGAHLVSAQQVRVAAQQEMELLVLRGPAGAIRAEAEALVAAKGLVHGKWVMTAGT